MAFSNAGDVTTTLCPAGCESEIDGFAGLEGRIGYILPDGGLIYATAGIVGAQATAAFNATNISATEMVPGFSIGLGYEHMLSSDWSVRGEITHMTFNEDSFFVIPAGYATITEINAVSVGIVRRF